MVGPLLHSNKYLTLFVLSTTFTRVKSGLKWSTSVIFGKELPSLHSPKVFLCSCGLQNIFHSKTPLSQIRCCKPLAALLVLPWKVLS